MGEPVRHRQTKGAETDMFDLQPPRHTSTLPIANSLDETGSGPDDRPRQRPPWLLAKDFQRMHKGSVPLRVAVAGGSIGGLCAGIALRAIGCDVAVYERTPGAMTSCGAGIAVQDDLLDLLRRSGTPALPLTSCRAATVPRARRRRRRTPPPYRSSSAPGMPSTRPSGRPSRPSTIIRARR